MTNVKLVVILFRQEGWPMNNSLDEIIKERLKNRYEWKNYLGWLLTHKELQMQAKKEFYKDKFILNLFLKLYFLPYNTLRYLSYLCDRHKFQMIENEIEMLKKARRNEDEQS